jgi:hypothetical protein
MIRTIKAIAEGLSLAVLGMGLLWLTLPSGFLNEAPAGQGGLLNNVFARRWGGACGGWTRDVALLHVVNDLLLWNAYTVVSLVMWRLHPIIKRAPTMRITLPLICIVFLTCGATHLFSAYAVFNPIYVFDGAFKAFAGIIGAFCAVYISHDLVKVYGAIEYERGRLKHLEARLAGESEVAQQDPVKVGSRGRVFRTVLEGIALSLLGLLLWLPGREPVSEGFFRNNFASQWLGLCTGWTKPLAFLYVAGSWLTWTAYVLIGYVVFRLHPISSRVRLARVMVPVVSAILVSCGSVHLVEAYAIFNPIFIALGTLKLVVAAVSLLGTVLVAQALVAVFDVAIAERRRLAELELRLARTG